MPFDEYPPMTRTPARLVATGVFWLGLYLTLVLAPLFVLLVGSNPPGLGFWWDLSVALGFAGLAMMGVQFILTARFRRATAPFGIDIIYYFHRYLGIVALIIVLAHPTILIAENPAVLGFLNPFVAPWHMSAGAVSVVALVAVIATSVWRKALGLPYERWRAAHTALSVLAVGLALVHIEGVQYYVASPWKRAVWRVFALSWIAVVCYVRAIRPWHLRRHPYRVVDLIHERGDAWTVALQPRGHAGLSFQPGQFAWLTLRGSPFVMQEHPFSFSSSPTLSGGRLEFTIKELGDFTKTIGTLRRDDLAFVDGPYGAFTIDRHQAPGYVFVAGGIGIAPIMSMLRALAERADRRPLLLFYAYRCLERLTFDAALDALRPRLNLKVVLVLEEPPDGWNGERGRITREVLERHLPQDRTNRDYFVCGPQAMTQAMERLLDTLGVPMSRIHSELFELV
jgi:predicted ferric reductase